MFVSINFWFRPYEFLCSSLSFFENKGSILYIKECHSGMVKIVSASHSIFISEKRSEKRLRDNKLSVSSILRQWGVHLAKYNSSIRVSNSCTRIFKSCLYHSFSVHFRRDHNSLILREKMLFSGPVLL